MRHLTIGLLFALTPIAAFAGPASDIHFSADGKFTATNLVVYQKAGNNLFCRGVWGSAFVRLVVLANPQTLIYKDHGEKALVSDISEGDYIDVQGTLATGADSILITATYIKDTALQTDAKTLSGTVLSVDTSARTLIINEKTYGKTTVLASRATITKGVRSIALGDIKAGDKILSVAGTYDHSANSIDASSVDVYQDSAIFTARNFEGTLKSISGSTLPVTLVVNVGGTDYTVYAPAGTAVLKKNRAEASLSRYLTGDTVRFYGAIRQTNLTEVDAEVLRDLNF